MINCQTCKYISSVTYGDNYNEPRVTEEFCDKGFWEYEDPKNIANCSMYQYFDWAEYFRRESEEEKKINDALFVDVF